ncbi:MAG: hypothetical protein QM736_05285 [Vicinamibacterales bacterium]
MRLFVARLVAELSTFVDDVFGCCEGYPTAGTSVPVLARHYLLARDQGADALFVAFPNHSVPRIHEERDLRQHLARTLAGISERDVVDGKFPPPLRTSLYNHLRRSVFDTPTLRALLTLPARMIPTRGLRLFQRLVRTVVVLTLLAFVGWAYRAWPSIDTWLTGRSWMLLALTVRALSGTRRFVQRIAWLLVGIALVKFAHDYTRLEPYISWIVTGLHWVGQLLFPAALAFGLLIVVWLIAVQVKETFDVPDPSLPTFDSARETRLRAMENRGGQNHLAGFNLIKPGRLRLWTLRIVLAAVHLLKQIENKGDLSGVETIHFARWVIIEAAGRHWLLFLSNYDDDWDAYLGDFVSEASPGVTAIWSNCVGFPRSWFLVLGGSRDERSFKSYARKSQFETLFRFSAYPGVAIADIASHAAIRETLGGDPEPAAIDDFLRRL